MREEDVRWLDGAKVVEVVVRARDRMHAIRAMVEAEDHPPSGYRLSLAQVTPIRRAVSDGRGSPGRKRDLVLEYRWTEKPEHHRMLEHWSMWRDALASVVKHAGAAAREASP